MKDEETNVQWNSTGIDGMTFSSSALLNEKLIIELILLGIKYKNGCLKNIFYDYDNWYTYHHYHYHYDTYIIKWIINCYISKI